MGTMIRVPCLVKRRDKKKKQVVMGDGEMTLRREIGLM